MGQTLSELNVVFYREQTIFWGQLCFYLMSEGSVQLSDCEHHHTNTSLSCVSGFSIHTDAGVPLLQL